MLDNVGAEKRRENDCCICNIHFFSEFALIVGCMKSTPIEELHDIVTRLICIQTLYIVKGQVWRILTREIPPSRIIELQTN